LWIDYRAAIVGGGDWHLHKIALRRSTIGGGEFMNTVETRRNTTIDPIRPHIASLDGLRFIAAGSVLFSHGYFYILLLQQNSSITAYNAPFVALANVGMTLFFVLSGFVIHYNYGFSVTLPGGVRAFFVARFARLYPLFLLVFVISTVEVFRTADGKVDNVGPIPLFLTFTQSWWFWVFGDRAASEAYSNATGLMWSLSTEAFFYLSYPLLAPMLRRLLGTRLVVIGCIVAVIGAGLAYELTEYRGYLNNWAAFYTGNPRAAHDFSHWLIYNSPWIRIFEFLIGAVTAQFVMTTKVDPARAMVAGSAALAVIVAAYVYSNVMLLPLSGSVTTCVAGAFGIVMGASVVNGQVFSRVLSNRWMVYGGEASYSLYLLHYWVMHNLGRRFADNQPLVIRIVLFVILMLVAVAVARISYLVYERPMIRVVRRFFSIRPRAERHDESIGEGINVEAPPASVPLDSGS
jgi:peptidoglycan/LPS O-acetylase OafA/YrhL